MRSFFPISLLGLVATGVVFVLQLIPIIDIFLMVALAMLWSVVLVNASMIGVALEAVVGRVSRLWLLLPVTFYGGYAILATLDHAALLDLKKRYDLANERVVTGFDPSRHALVFDGEGDGAWLTQNYFLPVAYTAKRLTEGYVSKRIIESSVCAGVRSRALKRSAFVHTYSIYDGRTIGGKRSESRFCVLSMPERPTLPRVVVERKETKGLEKTLPLEMVTTTIAMPDGRRFELSGGTAAPLSWIPMPIIGCALNSGNPSWECGAVFSRNRFTPIVSDNRTLARVLGLRPMAIADRVGSDSNFVFTRIDEIEKAMTKKALPR